MSAAAAAVAAAAQAPATPDLEEEMFSKLLEHSDDCFSLGTGTECEFESAAVPRKLGYSRLGAVNLDNIHPEDRAPAAADFVRCLAESAATGAPVSHSRVMRLLTGADRKGPPLWFDVRLTACAGSKWFIMMHDVSESKRAERSLHDWLATMSHDARTPLNSIKVSCTLLRACGLCAEARELLAAVAGGTRVLLATVNHVMLLKRLDAEGGAAAEAAPADAAPADAARLARGVVASVTAGLAQQYGVNVALEVAEGLAPLLTCHAEHAEHILLSLLVYGVQAAGGAAAGARSVRVRVWCEHRLLPGACDEQHCLMLHVSVPGHVLTPAQLAVLFDPFTSAGCGPEPEGCGGGSGSGRLGLHAARRLAGVLGGALVARSSPEAGSCFVAALPAAAADAGHAGCCAHAAVDADGDALQAPPLPPVASEVRASAAAQAPPSAAAAAHIKAQVLAGDQPFSAILETHAPASGQRFEELKRSGKLREMMDLLLAHAATEGFTVLRDGRLLYASPAVVRLLRYGSHAELLRADPIESTHPDDRAHVRGLLAAARAECAAAGGTTVRRTLTSRLRRADGTYVWVEHEMCISVRDSYNIVRDVTDRERLSASLKAFLAVTMQDMLMPVTLVQTASQLLSQLASVRGNDEAQFLVGAISAASRLLNGIVSNVLSLRALEAGKCSVVAAPFSVRDAVAGVLSVCSTTFTARPLRWTDEHEHLPARALGDGDRLAQILLNLLTNAAKFADGSEVTVSVRVGPRAGGSTDAAAAMLTLAVADGGRGMSAEECAHAFEPYYRAPSHMGGGTGLGLYVCKRFSEAMGGTVRVSSAPGQGSIFTVEVPMTILLDKADDGGKEEAAAPAGAAEAAEPPQTPPLVGAVACAEALESPRFELGSPSARGRTRVLLVDDHSLNLKLCKKVLEVKAGMDVVTAEDGDLALAWLLSSYEPCGPRPVDLVLMDMSMPRMDGLEATRQFRRWEREHRAGEPRLPIIALSANVFDEAMAECTAAGMDGFTAKPLRLDLLRATLATRLPF